MPISSSISGNKYWAGLSSLGRDVNPSHFNSGTLMREFHATGDYEKQSLINDLYSGWNQGSWD